jgi:hypothetical protein
MNLFDNPYCYYKTLYQCKKFYKQRGAFRRHSKKNNMVAYFNRFGEIHFKTDIIQENYFFT